MKKSRLKLFALALIGMILIMGNSAFAAEELYFRQVNNIDTTINSHTDINTSDSIHVEDGDCPGYLFLNSRTLVYADESGVEIWRKELSSSNRNNADFLVDQDDEGNYYAVYTTSTESSGHGHGSSSNGTSGKLKLCDGSDEDMPVADVGGVQILKIGSENDDGEMEYSYMVVKSSRLYSLRVEDMSIRTRHGQKYTSLTDEVAMASDGTYVHIMLESGSVLVYDQYRKQIEGIDSDFLSVFDTTYVGVHSVKRIFLDDGQLLISNYNVYAIDEGASSDERTSVILEATYDEETMTRKTYQNGTIVGDYIIFGTVTDTYDEAGENIISSIVGAEVYKKSDFSLYQTIDDLEPTDTMAIIKGFTATVGNDGFIIKWSSLNNTTMHMTEYRLKADSVNPATADGLVGYAVGVLVLGGTAAASASILKRR